MIDSNAVSALTPLISQYKKRLSHVDIDVREGIALVDLHLRLAYTAVISNSRRPLIPPIKLASSPGFGTMLAVLREGSKQPLDLGTQWITELVTGWSTDVVSAIDKFKAPKHPNFKHLRDRLSHGSPLPSDERSLLLIRGSLGRLLESLQNALEQRLGDLAVVEKESKIFLQKTKERASLEMSPLWVSAPEEAGLCIYSHSTIDAIHYLNPQGDIWSERTEDLVTKFVRVFIGEKIAHELGKLVNDTVLDIAAYTEDYSKPSYFFGDEDKKGTLHVPWTRSTSEGNDPRIDSFRIGPDGRREWQNKKNEWMPYSDFLKNISNWQILARRVAIGLNNFTSERDAEESSRLGLANSYSARGPSLLRKQQDSSSPTDAQEEEFDLMTKVDDSCQRIKPSTSVYFLIGQAGLGKTELMVSLAKERAAYIEREPSTTKPLYLFVSSTGRTLSSLEDAVNSALNITKVLSSQSAKALCRNGLLVLLVDGFDELLGSSGYENALGSLEPWFKELGGRGVLVASARSSYYLTQYRRSLAKASHLNVDHTLAELQPWNKSASEAYLREMEVPQAIISSIKDRDWKILGVPFFAKAFAAWVSREHQNSHSMPSIYEIVIEQYLDREAQKLIDPNSGALLNSQELRTLFSEAAELMQSSLNREIEQSDLIMCAESVVGTHNLDIAKPGLTRRLSSLCGLGVTTDSSGQNQFGFSHEVLFDCFLSLAIQQRISGKVNKESLLKLFKSSTINPSVFEWLVEKKPQETTALAKEIQFKIETPKGNHVLSANLGSLWEALLKKNDGAPISEVAYGLQLDDIQLSDKNWKKLDLRSSFISSLKLPSSGEGNIDISGAQIDYLESRNPDYVKRRITGISEAGIHSIYIGDSFGEGRIQVRKTLEALELIAAAPTQESESKREIAKDSIERLARRPDVQIILDRDSLTVDDPRLSWVSHIDNGNWRAFVNALVESNISRLERLTTSGRPKSRLIFNKPPATLIDPEFSDAPEVIQFWKLL